MWPVSRGSEKHMVDWADIAKQTDQVASAMHQARLVLRRADGLLHHEDMGRVLSGLMRQAESATQHTGELRRLEDDASVKWQLAGMDGDRDSAVRSEAADEALREAYRPRQRELAGVAPALHPSIADLSRLHGDLQRCSTQLDDAHRTADALHQMPEYGGTSRTEDLLANVGGVKKMVDKVERGVGDGLQQLKVAESLAQRFGQDRPNVRSRTLTEDVTSTAGRLKSQLGTAQATLQDAGTLRLTNADSALQLAIEVAVSAKTAEKAAAKEATDLQKSMQAATNPTAPSQQQTLAESDPHRRPGGPAQEAGVER